MTPHLSPTLTARAHWMDQAHRPFLTVRFLVLGLGLGLGLCLGMVPAKAADTSSAAAAALKVLTAGAQPAMDEDGQNADSPSASKTALAQTIASHTITVQSGESIDAVLRRALPGLPLKEDFLRQALAQANPKIFPKGKTYPVRPGTVLTVPTLAQLRQMILLQNPAAASLFEAPPALQADAPKGPDKRQWVRFP